MRCTASDLGSPLRADDADHASPTITIVIPALNEARNLVELLPQLPAVHQVVLVDGRSVDDTVATARAVLPDILVITQTRSGKGNALACGFAAATGDVIIMFDADGSADPAEIPRFVAALQAGAAFAKGSRFTVGGGSEDITALRRLGNAALNGVFNLTFGTAFTDLCYGYNAFWRDALPLLELPAPEHPATMCWGDGFEIESMINCRFAAAGAAIAEVPSVERSRRYGVSNLRTFADGFRVLRTVLIERRRTRSTRPIRIDPTPGGDLSLAA